MRFNDGAIDPAGRFFAGSMTDSNIHPISDEGALFVLSPNPEEVSTSTTDTSTNPALLAPLGGAGSAHIPNGMGWSNDGKTFFYTDSPTKTIWAFDYDVEKVELTNKRAWWVCDGEKHGWGDVVPDGFAMDAAGDIWAALWGGGRVVRISDVDGERKVTAEVKIPASCTTCPVFVGGGWLVVTTASVVEDEEAEAEGVEEKLAQDNRRKVAGRVYRVNVGVEGMERRKFKGRIGL